MTELPQHQNARTLEALEQMQEDTEWLVAHPRIQHKTWEGHAVVTDGAGGAARLGEGRESSSGSIKVATGVVDRARAGGTASRNTGCYKLGLSLLQRGLARGVSHTGAALEAALRECLT